MSEESNGSSGIKLSVAALFALVSGAFAGGGSVAGAILSIQNAERSANLITQQAEAIGTLNTRLTRLESDIIRRTAERWTRADQSRHDSERSRDALTTERRLTALERLVDREIEKRELN